MKTGNRGEWGELLFILREIIRGCLLYVWENERTSLPVSGVMRYDFYNGETHLISYVLNGFGNPVFVYDNGVRQPDIPFAFLVQAEKIIAEGIRNGKGHSFAINGAEEVLRIMHLRNIRSSSRVKADVEIVLPNESNPFKSTSIPASIKYLEKSDPSIINASKATNALYFLPQFDRRNVDAVNSICKQSDGKRYLANRIKAIGSLGCKLKPVGFSYPEYMEILQGIHPSLPSILACLNLERRIINKSSCLSVLESVEEKDPLGFQTSGAYLLPFSDYLVKSALSITPTGAQSGEEVRCFVTMMSNGSVFAVPTDDKSKFGKLLLSVTRFDSGSPSRLDFGRIHTDSENLYFDLNMSLRYCLSKVRKLLTSPSGIILPDSPLFSSAYPLFNFAA